MIWILAAVVAVLILNGAILGANWYTYRYDYKRTQWVLVPIAIGVILFGSLYRLLLILFYLCGLIYKNFDPLGIRTYFNIYCTNWVKKLHPEQISEVCRRYVLRTIDINSGARLTLSRRIASHQLELILKKRNMDTQPLLDFAKDYRNLEYQPLPNTKCIIQICKTDREKIENGSHLPFEEYICEWIPFTDEMDNPKYLGQAVVIKSKPDSFDMTGQSFIISRDLKTSDFYFYKILNQNT